jgi:hypothetical protein
MKINLQKHLVLNVNRIFVRRKYHDAQLIQKKNVTHGRHMAIIMLPSFEAGVWLMLVYGVDVGLWGL